MDVSSVVLPLALKAMPPEGTLEFWFSPDGDPEHVRQYATVLAADQEVMSLDTAEAIRVAWLAAEDKPEQVLFRDPMARAVWLHQGEWHHVAVEWDQEAVRLYVDGALASYSTARPLPFLKLPSAIKLGGTHILNAWSGVVDEVRLSDIKRYGPVVPSGVAWQPLAAAPQQAAAAAKPAAPRASPPRRISPRSGRSCSARFPRRPPAQSPSTPRRSSRCSGTIRTSASSATRRSRA